MTGNGRTGSLRSSRLGVVCEGELGLSLSASIMRKLHARIPECFTLSKVAQGQRTVTVAVEKDWQEGGASFRPLEYLLISELFS